jgi:hypothetical protein
MLPDQYSKHHARAGRIGGIVRGALKTNEEGRKAAARRTRMSKYDDMIPPGVTDPVDRARRRDALLRADMVRLAKKSAEKRAKPKPGQTA